MLKRFGMNWEPRRRHLKLVLGFGFKYQPKNTGSIRWAANNQATMRGWDWDVALSPGKQNQQYIGQYLVRKKRKRRRPWRV